MADPAPIEIITFKPWEDPIVDQFDLSPTCYYSRLAWLPILGPASWVMLGSISLHLQHLPSVTWRISDLGRDHGLGNPARPNHITVRTLAGLERFSLIHFEFPAMARARTKMPPLSPAQLRRAPRHVQLVHRQMMREHQQQRGA